MLVVVKSLQFVDRPSEYFWRLKWPYVQNVCLPLPQTVITVVHILQSSIPYRIPPLLPLCLDLPYLIALYHSFSYCISFRLSLPLTLPCLVQVTLSHLTLFTLSDHTSPYYLILLNLSSPHLKFTYPVFDCEL